MVGEDVEEGEGVGKVLIGEQSAEDIHRDGDMQDSLGDTMSGLQDCRSARALGCMPSIRLQFSLFGPWIKRRQSYEAPDLSLLSDIVYQIELKRAHNARQSHNYRTKARRFGDSILSLEVWRERD